MRGIVGSQEKLFSLRYLVLEIALLTVSSHTIKAAMANPVEALRYA
jgi:hypothetical protein